jgi:hypothetical protein
MVDTSDDANLIWSSLKTSFIIWLIFFLSSLVFVNTDYVMLVEGLFLGIVAYRV